MYSNCVCVCVPIVTEVSQSALYHYLLQVSHDIKSTAFALDGLKHHKSTKMSSVKSYRSQEDDIVSNQSTLSNIANGRLFWGL